MPRGDVRIDYREVRATFANYVKAMGGRVANSPLDHGAYQLDRQGGGWRIEIIRHDKTVTSLDSGRMTSAQIISHMRFAIMSFNMKDNLLLLERVASDSIRTAYTAVYAAEHAINDVNQRLVDIKRQVPSFDFEPDWDRVKDEDDRCEWCIEHGVENCRHVGM